MLTSLTKSKKIAVMLGVLSTLLLSALDQTIVSTAMPRIVQDLQGLSHLSWVFTAYMLSSTVTVPIYGKLSDIYGRKNFYLLGIAIFLFGSILSGLSQNMLQLILFRGLQGIGGGAMMANSFAIIGDLFPPSERGKWQGLFGGVFGLASIIGPSLGGWLTDNASWRWNFYINIPFGILAICLIYFLMPKITSEIKERSIDYLGAAFLSCGLISLLLFFVWGGNQFAWTSWQIFLTLGISAWFLIMFGFIEHFAREPIIPLSLFKNSIFSLSVIIVFLLGMGMFGAILYIPLFAQGVLGVSATNSGAILTPMMIGMVISSIIAGQIVSRTGQYKWLTVSGIGVITIALYLLSTMDSTTTQLQLVERMVLTGVGLGVTMPIFNIIVQNAFDHSKLGVVTSAVQLFRSVGGTVGTAIMASILNNGISNQLSTIGSNPGASAISQTLPQFQVQSINVNTLQGFLSPQVQNQVQSRIALLPQAAQAQVLQDLALFFSHLRSILASSIDLVFFIGSIFMALAFVISFFLKEEPLRKSHVPSVSEIGQELDLEFGQSNDKDKADITPGYSMS